MGSVIARPYPQAATDVDRTDSAFLDRLNEDFVHGWTREPEENGPRLLVQPDGNGGIGVTASGDFAVAALVYAEEPSVRSHLLREPRQEKLCENCKGSPNLGLTGDRAKATWKALTPQARRENRQLDTCTCVESDLPMYFCRANEGSYRTCLGIARDLFHNKACGKNWRWLHNVMQPNPAREKPKNPAVNNERHGTILSLLLREVFDMTLLARQRGSTPNVLAHEIDSLLPLCGGEDLPTDPEQRFPFGYAANIIVPFDILLVLGVNIFKDLTFDTWVIQTVLRKLLLNVVPWDPHRRGPTDEMDSAKNREDAQADDPPELRPNFENLYVHTGFSLFNHACRESANARFYWDNATDGYGIANRILVQTTRAVADGEEIRVAYCPEGEVDERKKIRLFGRGCDCEGCQG